MKKRNVFFINLFMAFCFMLNGANAQTQNTQVTISDIRSEKGQIVLNVFKDEQSYQKEQPYKQIKVDKKGLDKGKLVIHCTLEAGTYGVTLLDDENGNGIMDKNMVRMPREGFGFSNFFMEKLKKPSFDDFKMQLKNQDNQFAIRVKYM
ncbi:DUF2141 domain-containing protein [Dyadobacter subterraneus]|uniref:DUF2141 domain-containing protein n=1 Tax=Dyadobacter subterraneus TaxID=2773304 RepID=A0ABR9WA28_9BACT|nr:DUF2141 domain-containing protein [Dyadobacter subterraneus]MBE9461994.1 DUF2141 domain-containing protein [Dyadobacter subterraneus]